MKQGSQTIDVANDKIAEVLHPYRQVDIAKTRQQEDCL